MSKLHFWQNNNKEADGEGDISETFNATITWGSVKKNHVYEVRQGTSVSGDNYTCKTGASSNGTAKFEKNKDELIAADDVQIIANRTLMEALEANTKTVTVKIPDLKQLKANGYKLCFAKKVMNEYDVIWESSDKYLEENYFSWIPVYQFFGSNVFNDAVKVHVTTNLVSIGLGEKCCINQYGHIEDPKTGGAPKSINFVNEYGSIHPGLNQICTRITGEIACNPIYVAKQAALKGEGELTPKEYVQVWFQQNVETSTMFSTVHTKFAEIDLTNNSSAVVEYKNEEWIIP